jgi:predicted nucleic acid binding AN1-type Zn finger protein
MNPIFIFGILLLFVLAYFIWKEFKPDFKLPFTQKMSKKDVKKMLDEKIFLPKNISKSTKRAPISGKCYKCSKKTTMPYKCKFCGGLYCDKHRLPESHDCEGLKKLKRDKNK